MKILRFVIAALVVLMFSACAGNKPRDLVPVAITPTVRTPPATSMQPCPPLGELADPSFGDVARKLLAAALAYKACEARRAELGGFILSEND